MPFEVGQKVVCVDPEIKNTMVRMLGTPLVKGNIYTIDFVIDHPEAGWNYQLKEIPLKHKSFKIGSTEFINVICYGHSHFRPLEESKKGMETLTSILADPSKKIEDDNIDKKKVPADT